MNQKNYYLKFANRQIWQIKACEPEIADIVDKFADICSFGEDFRGDDSNILSCEVYSFVSLDDFRTSNPHLIETGRKHFFRIFFDREFKKSYFFINTDENISEIMIQISVHNLEIALQMQLVMNGSCSPCHCSLVEINGLGAIIAGVGDSGKSTCAARLSLPNRAFADDYAIVFEVDGKYMAQSMPTWSNYINGDLCYKADCSHVIEIDSFFFLKQSPKDYTEKVNGILKSQYLNNSFQDLLSIGKLKNLDDEFRNEIRRRIFDFSGKIAGAKPGFMLYATINGDFWNKMYSAMIGNNQI